MLVRHGINYGTLHVLNQIMHATERKPHLLHSQPSPLVLPEEAHWGPGPWLQGFEMFLINTATSDRELIEVGIDKNRDKYSSKAQHSS